MDATHLKIISLEHQVAVLTQAVTMLLDMKADAEKYALERAKQYIEEIPTWPAGKNYNTPPRRVFFDTYDSGYRRPNGKGSNRVEDFIDAAAELKTNADKTDRLLSELTKPATVISQATPVTEPVIVEDTTPSKTLVASSKEYIRITPQNAHNYIGQPIIFTSRGKNITKTLLRVSDTGKTVYINHPDLKNSLEIVNRKVFVLAEPTPPTAYIPSNNPTE